MNLADTLERLSELLPERVERDRKGDRFISIDGQRHMSAAYRVGDLHKWSYVNVCEAGLDRESRWLLCDELEREIEARGWNWELAKKGVNPDGSWQYWAHIWHPKRSRPEVIKLSSTIPEALALALIAALEAEAQP